MMELLKQPEWAYGGAIVAIYFLLRRLTRIPTKQRTTENDVVVRLKID